MPLAGKTALITGAGSGIGRALAVEAARRRLAVLLVGRREATLSETAMLLGDGARSRILVADVTQPQARAAIRDTVDREFGRLDLLVNNAGIVSAGPLSELDDDGLERLLATNLAAPIALTRVLLPQLRAAAPARIVNIGSMVGDIALPLFAAYSASKFGLRGVSDALRRELAGGRIGVTYAAPRGAATEATAAVARFAEPFGMRLDTPERIAGQVWDAVEAGRDTVYARGPERLFLVLQRLAPRLIDRALIAQLAASDRGRLSANAGPPTQALGGSQSN